MNLRVIKANMTELTTRDAAGRRIRVLFSYNTPVAYDVSTANGMVFYRTEQFYSKTTTKHINSWLPKEDALEVPQSEIDALVEGK